MKLNECADKRPQDQGKAAMHGVPGLVTLCEIAFIPKHASQIVSSQSVVRSQLDGRPVSLDLLELLLVT